MSEHVGRLLVILSTEDVLVVIFLPLFALHVLYIIVLYIASLLAGFWVLVATLICGCVILTSGEDDKKPEDGESLDDTYNNSRFSLQEGELFEGDLKITEEMVRRFYDLRTFVKPENCEEADLDIAARSAGDREGEENDGGLWKFGITPYAIGADVPPSLAITIRNAMDHWEDNTCLYFVRRDPQNDTDYVYFTSNHSEGCYSDYVGRKGGRQIINIASGCGSLGEIVHLIGHAIGCWHEQSRPDRDSYILVVPENIEEGEQHHFMKRSAAGNAEDYRNLAYDYASIMHQDVTIYSACTTKPEACPTLVPKYPDAYEKQGSPAIGQREALSEEDIYKVTLKYSDDAPCPRPFLRGILQVHVQDGWNIPHSIDSSNDNSDPYIKITCMDLEGDITEKETSVKWNERNPNWDEWLDMGAGDFQYYRIRVWEYDGAVNTPMSLSQTVMIDKEMNQMDLKHCVDTSCSAYVNFNYNFIEDGDECSPNPCQNGGTCTDSISNYTCSCPIDWLGRNCEIPCPCQNGGSCIDHTPSCSCPTRWLGVNCGIPCPCQHGGSCIGRTTSCTCPSGRVGANCQQQCPCQNGGSCVGSLTSYSCSCPSGWVGANCQQRCPCQNGGSCVGSLTSYSCSCPSGWVGANCQQRCPCQNGGSCVGSPTSYSCSCPSGWVGSTCGTRRAYLKFYVRYGTGLPDEDPWFNDSDPYTKIVCYDTGGNSVTKTTSTDQGDESPTWNQWLYFGTDTWSYCNMKVYDEDYNSDDSLSNWERVTIYAGSCRTYRTHYCHSGYIKYDYCFN